MNLVWGTLSLFGVIKPAVDKCKSSDSTNSMHGAVKNLYTQDGDFLSAGGSSGGSAVAVMTGQCDA